MFSAEAGDGELPVGTVGAGVAVCALGAFAVKAALAAVADAAPCPAGFVGLAEFAAATGAEADAAIPEGLAGAIVPLAGAAGAVWCGLPVD